MSKLRDDLQRLELLRARLVVDYDLAQEIGPARQVTRIEELSPNEFPNQFSASPLQALIFGAFRQIDNEILGIRLRLEGEE